MDTERIANLFAINSGLAWEDAEAIVYGVLPAFRDAQHEGD